MSFEDFKKELVISQLAGASLGLFVAADIADHNDKENLSAILSLSSVLVSQLTVLAAAFGAAFGIAKHCFAKTNGQAAKIGGIAIGIAIAAIVLFVIGDILIRSKVLEQRDGDVCDDLFCAEAVATLGIPAAIGFVECRIYKCCTGNDLIPGVFT